ncbi:MAG: ATP-binding cassette domain-containing protein, partial [Actinomycetota bacterium]
MTATTGSFRRVDGHRLRIGMSQGILKLDRVVVRRDGTEILRETSLCVDQGERWVVLGPNGSGKTT